VSNLETPVSNQPAGSPAPASGAGPHFAFARTDLRGRRLTLAELKRAVPRTAATSVISAEDAVSGIIADVRSRGFAALAELAEKFDGVPQSHPRVPAAALREALENLDPGVRAALEESIARAKAFAAAQRPANVDFPVAAGATVSQHWIPVRRVGLYVPGGLAAYPSSVIMNVVPALAAGVGSVALASPPQKEFGGLPDLTVLAAAALLGVDEVYAMGGAQAIAAFAYGVAAGTTAQGGGAALEPVDVVTGPGNIFVATAKRLVKGVVGIDSEAGATEIAVLADHTANPVFVAADLISQAEHDPNAASVLVTPSTRLADAVERELAVQVAGTGHRERVEKALSGPQSGTVLVDDLEQGVAVCNAYAAEHLEIVTEDAAAVAARITNAGAIFVGDYSPVSLGDYCAGSNHVLPTSGTAAFSSGLNVTTFLRAVQLINYNKDALRQVAGHVVTLAQAEGLPAHGDAVSARFA
jgi:histidinol dehydrogenase